MVYTNGKWDTGAYISISNQVLSSIPQLVAFPANNATLSHIRSDCGNSSYLNSLETLYPLSDDDPC
ncbi:hypothetical protein J6590_093333 [Homalodisca vitripennis]|nr:hypothetical protein J6590_021720 [Homalodisca vitripennis]KAG8265497.1 hypothetical protein J6590_093333 [Homalodisca vitripennis]